MNIEVAFDALYILCLLSHTCVTKTIVKIQIQHLNIENDNVNDIQNIQTSVQIELNFFNPVGLIIVQPFFEP